jgi:hypothetical protein
MTSGFKQFVLRGNVVDMAVGVVVGGAFAAVVAALTKDLLTPLIAALVGKPDFSAIRFTVNGSVFSSRRFHQCSGLVPFSCCSCLLLRDCADQCAVGGRIKAISQGVCRSPARPRGRLILSRRLREGDLKEPPAKDESCGRELRHRQKQLWSRRTSERQKKLISPQPPQYACGHVPCSRKTWIPAS